eukprot:2137831-Amphidinium_carterae.1
MAARAERTMQAKPLPKSDKPVVLVGSTNTSESSSSDSNNDSSSNTTAKSTAICARHRSRGVHTEGQEQRQRQVTPTELGQVIGNASCICDLGRGWMDSGGVYVGHGASSYGVGPSFWA